MTYVRAESRAVDDYIAATGERFTCAADAYRHQAAWLVSVGDVRRGRRAQLDERVGRLARLLRRWDAKREAGR